MEVQGRAALPATGLSGRAERVWALRWALLAFATVLTAAAVIVDVQPVRSPWWTYADADASYTGSGLNLMLGEEMTFVDHPGLPLTEAVAILAGIDALVEEGSLSHDARLRYVDRTLLSLDDVRWLFRGAAVLCWLLGAALAFLLAARLFGHWSWGLANGLLWLAAPGLIPMSIQLRPDVPLAVLCLVFAFAVARALEHRSVGWFAGAALVVGFAGMVKLHAFALLVPLVVAALWRPPPEREVPDELARARAFLRTRWKAVAAVAAPWVALVVLLNWDRFPFVPTSPELSVALGVALVAVGAVAEAEAAARLGAPRWLRRVASRFHALLVVSFVAGLAVPVALDVEDGVRALHYIVRNMSGEGVQEGVEPFSTPLSAVDDIVGTSAILVFLVGLAAGVVGAVRRKPVPVVWAVAALATGGFAYARPPNVHYFAPAFVFAALAMLWLFQREPRARMPLLAWAVVLYAFLPAWDGRSGVAQEQERFAELVAPAKGYVEPRLGAGEVAIVPSNWPFADSRYFELVDIYVQHTPAYPYRYLPATATGRAEAVQRALRPRFYVGPLAQNLTEPTEVDLGELGRFTIAPAEGLVAEIVAGPGVDRGWDE